MNMKHLAFTVIFLTLANTAHAGIFQGIADFYNSRDRCQLKNYPGGVEKADPSQLPSYCGKGTYAQQQRIERALAGGKFVVIGGASGYPNSERTNRVKEIVPVGDSFIVYHLDGGIEYIQ